MNCVKNCAIGAVLLPVVNVGFFGGLALYACGPNYVSAPLVVLVVGVAAIVFKVQKNHYENKTNANNVDLFLSQRAQRRLIGACILLKTQAIALIPIVGGIAGVFYMGFAFAKPSESH